MGPLLLFILLATFKLHAVPLPDFRGENLLTGTSVPPPSPEQKGTAVIFLSAKCPCSANHEKSLAALAQTFKDFSFIGVHSNANESIEVAKSHFDQAKLPFPVVQDQKSKLANYFGALKTPHVFLFSPTGKLLFNGGIDEKRNAEDAKELYLKTALLSVRSGKDPNPAEVRTLGCVIQR